MSLRASVVYDCGVRPKRAGTPFDGGQTGPRAPAVCAFFDRAQRGDPQRKKISPPGQGTPMRSDRDGNAVYVSALLEPRHPVVAGELGRIVWIVPSCPSSEVRSIA